MKERTTRNVEVMLSPEQQALADLARSLTALPEARYNERTSMRPTTGREKVSVALGRLFGSKTEREPGHAYRRTLRDHTTVKTLHLRDFRTEDANSENIGDHLTYIEDGGIYLQQRHVLTPPSDIRTEELSLLAIGTAYNIRIRSTSPGPVRAQLLWSLDLLKPMDPETLAQVRVELEEAASQHFNI